MPRLSLVEKQRVLQPWCSVLLLCLPRNQLQQSSMALVALFLVISIFPIL